MSAQDKTERIEATDRLSLQNIVAQSSPQLRTEEFRKPQEILLLGDNGLRRLELFYNQSSYILGRFSELYRYTNYIDLSMFGAAELGVSRVHAQLHMEAGSVYITDLNSKNGTFVAGSRLAPNQSLRVEPNHKILLGRLHLQLMFKLPNSEAPSS